MRAYYRIVIYAAAAAFFVMIFVAAGAIVDNGRLRVELAEKKRLLENAAASRRSRDRETAALQNEIGQLRAQKALYTATIETLARKERQSQ